MAFDVFTIELISNVLRFFNVINYKLFALPSDITSLNQKDIVDITRINPNVIVLFA